MQKNTFSLNVLEEVDEEILSRLERMNIDKKQARKYITGNQHNTVTTTYYLLLKQKLMAGGKIVTADMAQRHQIVPQTEEPKLQQPKVDLKIMNPTPLKTPLRLIPQGSRPEPATHSAVIADPNPKPNIVSENIQHPAPAVTTQPNRQVSREVSPKAAKAMIKPIAPIVISSKKTATQSPQTTQGGQGTSSPLPTDHKKQGIFTSSPPELYPSTQSDFKPVISSKIVKSEKESFIHQEEAEGAIPNVQVEVETLSRKSIVEVTSTVCKSDITKKNPSSSRASVKLGETKGSDTHDSEIDGTNLGKYSTSGSNNVKSLTNTMNKYSRANKVNVIEVDKNHCNKLFEVPERKSSQGQASELENSIGFSSVKQKTQVSDYKGKGAKASNIYKNLQRCTVISKRDSSFSKRSKGTTKSSSHSREKCSFLKTFEGSHERSLVATARKISNPSFQSPNGEDGSKRSLGFKHSNQESAEIRKSRNPFGLDLVTEAHPRDLMRELIASLKKERLASLVKVWFFNLVSLQNSRHRRTKDYLFVGSCRAWFDSWCIFYRI